MASRTRRRAPQTGQPAPSSAEDEQTGIENSVSADALDRAPTRTATTPVLDAAAVDAGTSDLEDSSASIFGEEEDGGGKSEKDPASEDQESEGNGGGGGGGGAAGGSAAGDGDAEPGGGQGEEGDGAELATDGEEQVAVADAASGEGTAEVEDGGADASGGDAQAGAGFAGGGIEAAAVETPALATPVAPVLSLDKAAASQLGEAFDAEGELARIQGRVSELTAFAVANQTALIARAESLASQADAAAASMQAEAGAHTETVKAEISGQVQASKAEVSGKIDAALAEVEASAAGTIAEIDGLIVEHQGRLTAAVETGKSGAQAAGTTVASTLQGTIETAGKDLATEGTTQKDNAKKTAKAWADGRSGSGALGRLKASCEKQAAKKLGDDYATFIESELQKTAEQAQAMAAGVGTAAPGSITEQVITDLDTQKGSADGKLTTTSEGAHGTVETTKQTAIDSLEAARLSNDARYEAVELELHASVDEKALEVEAALGSAGTELGDRLRAQAVELGNVHAELVASMQTLSELPQPLQYSFLGDTFDNLAGSLESTLQEHMGALDQALIDGELGLTELASGQTQGLSESGAIAADRLLDLQGRTQSEIDTALAELNTTLTELGQSSRDGLEPWTADLEAAGNGASATVQAGLDEMVTRIQTLFTTRKTELGTTVAAQLAKFGEYVEPKAAQELEKEKSAIDRRTQDIRKACDGYGTDEAAIHKAMRETPKEGMGYLESLYNKHYGGAGHTLRYDFDDELSGSDYQIAMAYLTGDRGTAIRLELADSTGVFNDDEARIEAVLMAADADDITALSKDPKSKATIESVRSNLGGADLDVFNSLVNPNLDRQTAKAQAGAARLFDAMDGMGTDEDEVYKRLEACKTPEERKALEAAFQQYAKDKGSSWAKGGDALKSAIKDDFSGAEKDLGLALSEGNKAAARAARLEIAADGGGTDEKKVFDNLKNPDLSIDPSKATNPVEKARLEKQKADAEKEQKDVKEIYEKQYGRSVEAMIQDEMGDASESDNYEAQVAKQYLDKGDADPELLIQYSIDGMGTNEDMLKDALRGKSKDEIKKIKAAYKAKYGKDLEDALGVNGKGAGPSEVSGKDAHELEIMLMGNPETYEDYKKIADKNTEFAKGGMLGEGLMALGGAVGYTDTGKILEHNKAELDEAWEALPESERGNKASADFKQQADFVNADATAYGDKMDSLVDTLVTTLELIAGAVATVLTAGAASPALAAIVANLAIGATGVALKALAKGDRMGYEEVLAEGGKVVISSLTAGAAELKSVGAVAEKLGGKITSATVGKYLTDPKKLKIAADLATGGMQNVITEVPSALVQTAMDEKTWDKNGMDLLGHFAGTAGTTGLTSFANGAVSTGVDTKIGEQSTMGRSMLKDTASGLAGDTAGYVADANNYKDAGQFWQGMLDNGVESLKSNTVNSAANYKARKYKAAAEIAQDPSKAADYDHFSPEEKAWVQENLPAYKKAQEEGRGTSMIEMALAGKGADKPADSEVDGPASKKPLTDESAPSPEDKPVVEEGAGDQVEGNASHYSDASSFHADHEKHTAGNLNVHSHMRTLTNYITDLKSAKGGAEGKVKIPGPDGRDAFVTVTVKMGEHTGYSDLGKQNAARFFRNPDGTYTVIINKGVRAVDAQRAIAHELAEIRYLEGRSRHTTKDDRNEGVLGADGDHRGLELTGHDVGRLGELELLFRKANHSSNRVAADQSKELALLIDHLGLNPKDTGYEQKMLLVREAAAQGYVSQEVLDGLSKRSGADVKTSTDPILKHEEQADHKAVDQHLDGLSEKDIYLLPVLNLDPDSFERNLATKLRYHENGEGGITPETADRLRKAYAEKQKARELMEQGVSGDAEYSGNVDKAVEDGLLSESGAAAVKGEVERVRAENDLVNHGLQRGEAAFEGSLNQAIADGTLTQERADEIRKVYARKTEELDDFLMRSGMLDADGEAARMLELHAKHANLTPAQVEALRRRVAEKGAQSTTRGKADAIADLVTDLGSNQAFGEKVLALVRGIKNEADAKVFREALEARGIRIPDLLKQLHQTRLSATDLMEFESHISGDHAKAVKHQVMNVFGDSSYKEAAKANAAAMDDRGVVKRAFDFLLGKSTKVLTNAGDSTAEGLKGVSLLNKDAHREQALAALSGLSPADRERLIQDPEFSARIDELKKSFAADSAELLMFETLVSPRKSGGNDGDAQSLDAWQMETTSRLAVAQIEQCFENMHAAGDKAKGKNFRAQLQASLATMGANPALYEGFLVQYGKHNDISSDDPRVIAAHLSERLTQDVHSGKKSKVAEVDLHTQDATRDLLDLAELNRQDQAITDQLKVLDTQTAFAGESGAQALNTDQKIEILQLALSGDGEQASTMKGMLTVAFGDQQAMEQALNHLQKKQRLERSARAELLISALKSGRTNEAMSLLNDPSLAVLDDRIRAKKIELDGATEENRAQVVKELAALEKEFATRGGSHEAFLAVVEHKLSQDKQSGEGRDEGRGFTPTQVEHLTEIAGGPELERLRELDAARRIQDEMIKTNPLALSGQGFNNDKTERAKQELRSALSRGGIDVHGPDGLSKLRTAVDRGLIDSATYHKIVKHLDLGQGSPGTDLVPVQTSAGGKLQELIDASFGGKISGKGTDEHQGLAGTRNDARFIKDLMSKGHRAPHDVIAQSLIGFAKKSQDPAAILAQLAGKSPAEIAKIARQFHEVYGGTSFAKKVSLDNPSGQKLLTGPENDGDTPATNTRTEDDRYRAWFAEVLKKGTGGRAGHGLEMSAKYGDTSKVFDPDKNGHDADKAQERLDLELAWDHDNHAYELDKDGAYAEASAQHESGVDPDSATGAMVLAHKEMQDILNTDRGLLASGHPEAWRRYEAAKAKYTAASTRRASERVADSKSRSAVAGHLSKAAMTALGIPWYLAPALGAVAKTGTESYYNRELTAQDYRDRALGTVFSTALGGTAKYFQADYFGDHYGRTDDGLSEAAKAAMADTKVDDALMTAGKTVVSKGVSHGMQQGTTRDDDKKALLKQGLMTDAGSLFAAFANLGVKEAIDHDGADSKGVDATPYSVPVLGDRNANKDGMKGVGLLTGYVNKAYADWLKKNGGGDLVQGAVDKRKAAAGQETALTTTGPSKKDAEHESALDSARTKDETGLSPEEKLQALMDNGEFDVGKLVQMVYRETFEE